MKIKLLFNPRIIKVIKISVLIIVTLSLLLTGGYFAIKYYKNYQSKNNEEFLAQQKEKEEHNSQIEDLKKQVEDLKDSQAKTQSQVQSQNKSQDNNSGLPQLPKLPKFTTSDIVNQNKKYIVNVACFEDNGLSSGSGIVIGKNGGKIIVLTNRHVTQYAKAKTPGIPPCMVNATALGEVYYAQPVFFPSVASEEEMGIIDFSFVEVRNMVPTTIVKIDSNGKVIESSESLITDLLNINSFPSICSNSLLQMGEDIVILGYPGVGSDISNLGELTATEGIISNNALGVYFTTSAKIEHGNSGGGAFLKSYNCLAGMPTYVRVGEIESLGRCLSLPYLQNKYLSK